MKRRLVVAILFCTMTIPTFAVDGKSLLIGISIGLGLYYRPVKKPVVAMGRRLQKMVRPLPQDKVEVQQRKKEQAEKKLKELENVGRDKTARE